MLSMILNPYCDKSEWIRKEKDNKFKVHCLVNSIVCNISIVMTFLKGDHKLSTVNHFLLKLNSGQKILIDVLVGPKIKMDITQIVLKKIY